MDTEHIQDDSTTSKEPSPTSQSLTTVEEAIKHEMIQRLKETGEYDRLKQDLYAHLILDESWRNAIRKQTQLTLAQCGGVPELTLDELSTQLIQSMMLLKNKKRSSSMNRNGSNHASLPPFDPSSTSSPLPQAIYSDMMTKIKKAILTSPTSSTTTITP